MTDISKKESKPNSRQMAIRDEGGKWNPRAIRLRVLRAAIFNEHQSAFARRLSISNQRLGNMENGFPISIDVANKIRSLAPGLSLDWLYHGEERGMSMDLVLKLRKEAEKPEYQLPEAIGVRVKGRITPVR